MDMTEAVAKSGRNGNRKYAEIASPPVADDLVEAQSIPNFSETEKLGVNKTSGNLRSFLCSFSLIAMGVQL